MLAKNRIYIALPLVFMVAVYKSGLVANQTRFLKPVPPPVGPDGTPASRSQRIPTTASHDVAFEDNISKTLHHNGSWSSAGVSSSSALGERRKENIPDATQTEKSETKKILFYTKFFSEGWQTFLGNRTNLTLQGCPEARCVFTFDPDDDQDDADALIFHANDFDAKAVPRARRPHQKYVWFNLEAPVPRGDHQRGRPWGRDFFNWTFTYNRDSDLFMPYGVFTPLQAEEHDLSADLRMNKSSTIFLKYMQDLNNNVSLEDDLQHDWSSFLRRPKIVAWMVSNCFTWSGREKYVQELQKYVQVDVYGKCGSLTCGKNHRDTYCYTDVLSSSYLFYLSFENNLCRDYITEKVWFPMLHGLVPVVYGGATYIDYLPPHSYIDARTLSPRDLAELLIK
ncbi:LOW QUALITY PROTEIN: alpha-(1,3)-fucosyltransferase C-like [Penaeus monodon]|uniref:LOW QUALITY PROTEIN: alpha-(1,3)-fucosyltransferase C-like n=1 Tax=Penaeus monodon TaxID=6687 RepID=UPI0018A770F7|nr:LOW QUALITY PROTEIN: alpha-(1,3)-fucosyltransferase C-like [Penaeus monodon]